LHALIVAGPSGAGKSSLLRELHAGDLAPHVRRHLPPGAQSWPVVFSNRPQEWQPFLSDLDAASTTAGFAVHYDITTMWRMLNQELEHDPFWQVLRRCEAVTLIVMRPTPRRLLDQWSHAHLGVRGLWRVHARRLLAASAPLLRACIRRLRIAKHPRIPNRARFPRPIRFLRRVDRALRSYRLRPAEIFDFYPHRGRVEQMLRSWNDVATAKTGALPVSRIELVPDPATEIGKTFGWQVQAIAAMERASAPERTPSPG